MSARRLRPRLLLAAAIAAGVLLLLGANGHLVWVAFSSRPDCVAHLKQPLTTGEVPAPATGPGIYRAAKSAC